MTPMNANVFKMSCALWGLSALGCQNRKHEIEQKLSSDYPRVRRFAIQALAQLFGEQSKDKLLFALRDSSPAVAKESARLINKYMITIELNELIVSCLSIAKKINKWDRLILLLMILGMHRKTSHIDTELINNINGIRILIVVAAKQLKAN